MMEVLLGQRKNVRLERIVDKLRLHGKRRFAARLTVFLSEEAVAWETAGCVTDKSQGTPPVAELSLELRNHL